MKQRVGSITLGALAISGVITALSVLEIAVPAADLPSAEPSALAPTNSLTLEAALRLALDRNPDLRSAGARTDAAAARAYQAKLWTNPELELNSEDWPLSDSRGFPDSKRTIGVGQTVPFPGKKKLDRQVGVWGTRLSEAEFSLRRLELIRDVKIAFYQALAAERLADVGRELMRVAESSADTARKRVAAGAAADQEQLRAEIPLEQTKIELMNFERELAEARQSLALLLGRPEFADARLAGGLAESGNLRLLQTGPEAWLGRHPSVVAVKTSRSRAEAELRRARLEPYPDVRVSVSGGRIGETSESIIQFGVSVPLPIIDRAKGKRQEAQANVRVAEADEAAIEQRLLAEWGAASQRYRTSIQQVAAFRERILPKADEAMRLVRTGFEEGKFGFMDFLDIQRTTGEARLAYNRKVLELNVAQAQLEALAAGSAGDLSTLDRKVR
jgi:cobalt-zinc-cadmium efflux system outer membrane protein